MKFSTLSTVITFLVYSNVSYAQCAGHISASQGCVKECVDTTATRDTTTNGSLLIQCINEGTAYSVTDLKDCCGMTDTCKISMDNAGSCLKNELTTVKSTSQTYLNCIHDASRKSVGDVGRCDFASFCVNVFTGGFGTNSTNDFNVGAGGALDLMARTATSCDDMTSLYSNACDTAKSCCSPCHEKIADVVSAVTNEILFPAYSTVTETCDKTCADVLPAPTVAPVTAPAVRKLEGESSTTATATATATATTTTTTIAEDNAEVVDLATECHDGLKQDIVVYNQTHAVDNFFECLEKKMGQIIANADTDAMIATQGTEEESSSSSSSCSGCSSRISSSMMLVVSAIASAIINY